MSDIPWTIILIIALIVILGFEAYAYFWARTTLSRYVVELTQTYPLLPFVVVSISGGLAVHFWLPWCP